MHCFVFHKACSTVCRFVYKYLHRTAPSYLVKMCIAVDSVESVVTYGQLRVVI